MAEKGINGLIDLIAGSIGGCATVLVGQPLDTVKVKMQAFSHLYRTSFDCFRKTLLKDGVRRGLYAGTIPALYANVAENSVLFCAYGFCQNGIRYISPLSNTCKSPNRPLVPVENAFAGFFAAFFSSFTLCPTELVKCKLQALRETGKSVDISAFNLTRDIVKLEGFRGLFHGLVPTLAREMPGYFCFFGGYELSKSFLTNKKPNEAGLGVTILSGGVGGASLWIAIFPFDVVKSKIQIESLSNVSMISVMRKIVKNEGIKGLYRGLFPTLLRTLPASGALFVAYEYSKFYMELGVREIGIL